MAQQNLGEGGGKKGGGGKVGQPTVTIHNLVQQ